MVHAVCKERVQMTDKDFLQIATEEGNKQQPPRNFGAVIVCGGKIIGQGHNHVYEDNDPSAHAEITAIRQAANKSGTKDLSNCTLYCSHEPCLMCFSCAGWANITRIVYARKANDQDFTYEFKGLNLHEIAKKFTRREVSVEYLPLLEKEYANEEKCVFCAEIEQGTNLIVENELWRARWDKFPLVAGHAEIVPRRHVERFEDLETEELGQMMKFARRVISIVQDTDLLALYRTMRHDDSVDNQDYIENALIQAEAVRAQSPDGYNLGINDGEAGGQTIKHLHLHVMPRFDGDVDNPRGGIRRIFPNDRYSKND